MRDCGFEEGTTGCRLRTGQEFGLEFPHPVDVSLNTHILKEVYTITSFDFSSCFETVAS